MKKIDVLLKLLSMVDGDDSSSVSEAESFLEIEKIYAIRTVTMIYTGRLKKVNKQELLIDEAAWIPDTERWADFVSTGAHKEAEPYTKPVVIGRGAILDCTEIPSVIRKQK